MGTMGPAFEIGVVTFTGSQGAHHAASGLIEHAEGILTEVAVLEHEASDRFAIHSYASERTRGANAATGAVVGAFFGVLLGPLGVVAGLAGGTAVGAAWGGRNPHDLTLSDAFVASLKAALPLDSSALLLMGDPEVVEQVTHEIHAADETSALVIREPLTTEQIAAIRDAISDAGGDASGNEA